MEDIEHSSPFVSEKDIDDAASRSDFSLEELAQVAPFLSEEFLDEYALGKISEGKGIQHILVIAPFLSDEALNEIADKATELSDIVPLLPFLVTRR